MKAKSRKKKLLPVAALLGAAALGVGLWLGTRTGGDPVNVYPFEYIGMTEFWGDTQESTGPVTTDKIQTAFLTDTQTVTEVAVQKGDQVKEGDILFSFDTTLDALSLERKRLEVEKAKVQIKAAEERLGEVAKLVPYVPAPQKAPVQEDLGEQMKDKLYQISEKPVYDGRKKDTALICWMKDDTPISDAILQALYETSLDYRKKNDDANAKKEASSASDVPQAQTGSQEGSTQSNTAQTYQVDGFYTCNGVTVEPDEIIVGDKGYLIKDSYTFDGKTYWLESAAPRNPNAALKDLKIDAYPENAEARAAWEALWKDGVDVKYMREVSVTGNRLENDAFSPIEEGDSIQLEVGQHAVFMFQSQITNPPDGTELKFSVSSEDETLAVAYQDGYVVLSGTPEKLMPEKAEYTVTAKYTFTDNHEESRAVEESFSFSISVVPKAMVSKGSFYVVFKTTKDNYLKGAYTNWQGYKVTVYEDGRFAILPYDASDFTDHTLPPVEDIEIALPEILPNEIYTAEQIVQMQTQLYTTIKEQQEKLKLAESEYSIMERELKDGNVYAEIDGKVISLLTPEEAREKKQPMVKISGGGGFYIEGSISELEKASMKIGQEVTVNDWNTGNVYAGEVVSIGDFPTDQQDWNGIGNPTAAYYPFKAFVGEEADLEEGAHVSVSYSTSEAEQGLYLDKAFVRTEQGKFYIYVRDDDGKLAKRTVQVGKVLWGSYYEILSGINEADYLAFPYDKNVKIGAPTVESNLDVLYGY